jgi:hypothetical protein
MDVKSVFLNGVFIEQPSGYMKEIELIYVNSQDQVVDIFTKSLPTMMFEKFKNFLGMK